MNENYASVSDFTSTDPKTIIQELKSAISGEVKFDPGSRALYSTDSSNYRQVPLGVVLPKTEEEVIKTVRICNKYKLPILTRGTGTSLAGQTTNHCVIIDCSRYLNNVLWIDPNNKKARVQPGTVIDAVNREANRHGLRFGPDPSTHVSCSIGGMIGNNACGVHSVMSQFAGLGARTSDNLTAMKILTYDGTVMEVKETSPEELEIFKKENHRQAKIYQNLESLRDKYGDLIRERYPKIPRRVSGYNLDDLLPEKNFQVAKSLVGSEGTCVIILEAELNLVVTPKDRVLAVVGFGDVYQAGDYVPEAMSFRPIACEGMDDILIGKMKKRNLNTGYLELLPEGKGWLLVEFGGDNKDEAFQKATDFRESFLKHDEVKGVELFKEKEDQEKMWTIRESGLGATAHVPNEKDAWEGWEDSAVPPEKIGDYMRDLRDLFNRYNYGGTFYGHFGQGIVHTRIDFGLKNKEGIEKFRSFLSDAADLVVKYGGSFSGEHGDGQSRAELLEKMYGPELVKAFDEFKKIWDPELKLNPHKVVAPYKITENLRYGENYDPPQTNTFFSYPDDKNSFSYAIERCVGVGKCRKTESGTMCPSYMATHDEKHSTRGRSRLLFEMLNGSELKKKNWRSKPVKEALDLCLACKACKSECPVSVDMATYKAEFRAQYYKNRPKPLPGYAMGLIDKWAALASKVPAAANFMTHSFPLGNIMKFLGGLEQKRDLPRFSAQTFKTWHKKNRSEPNPKGKKVILWADTFNNYFLPETSKAAYLVLQNLGYQVIVPTQKLCCGRPLYDFGMLKTARKYLARVMEALEDEIMKGTPLVGLEPSCISVFRDELTNLYPENEVAKKLAEQSLHLTEFLTREGAKIPEWPVKMVVHGHCHHRSVLQFNQYNDVLKHMKAEFRELDSGCCGMAGSFGFERKNYEVSVACGERVLAPAVRNCEDEVIVADGFSCREQIQSLTGKKSMHIAEVLLAAMNEEKAKVAMEQVMKE